MIRIKGALLVKKIKQSRNGPFCVADLVTDVAEFKVKDPMLDQFDEGRYTGEFWISEIKLQSYISYGRMVAEMRAILHDMQIDATDELPREASKPQQEPDPLDELPTQVTPRVASPEGQPKLIKPIKVRQLRTEKSGQPALATAADIRGPLVELYGEELADKIVAREQVKLDATVDRAVLRAQASALTREHRYAFDPKTQVWDPLP